MGNHFLSACSLPVISLEIFSSPETPLSFSRRGLAALETHELIGEIHIEISY